MHDWAIWVIKWMMQKRTIEYKIKVPKICCLIKLKTSTSKNLKTLVMPISYNVIKLTSLLSKLFFNT